MKDVKIGIRIEIGEISAYKMLVRKPGRKRPLGRPKHRWEDNIKMVLKGMAF
jgi:hypothetical protein